MKVLLFPVFSPETDFPQKPFKICFEDLELKSRGMQ